jgi:hypothetical protein
MRGVVLACVLAACGNDAGLLLDVHPGDPGVTRVEVLLPNDNTPGTYMGVPTGVLPAAQGQKIPGPVYGVVDRTGGTVDSGGALRVLLTPGEVTQVPAILVLGYDANNTPIRYAVVTDPMGDIQLPHTTSAHLVVDLEPITTVPLNGAPNATASPRLVRWDGTTFDDATARCFGILEGTASERTGTFFGPDDDVDCDHAQPECDETWYLRVRGASKCATTMPGQNDPETMDACRIGDSAGCRDGDPNAMVCVAQLPAVCVPAEVCGQCGDQLDPSCTIQQLADPKTSHVECTIYVKTDASTGNKTYCDMPAMMLPMSPPIGTSYTCSGVAGFADPMMPANMLTATLPLDASPTDRLAFSCHADQTDFSFAVTNVATASLDPALPETNAVMLFGVRPRATTTTTRLLALPIHIQYVDIGNDAQMCPTPALQCDLLPDANTQADDPIWHCAGG